MSLKRVTGGLFLGMAVLNSIGRAQERLIAVDSSRALYDIDMTTGAKTQFGTVSANASTTAGLAYDRANGIMYLTSTGNDSLYTLDLATGAATLVGPYDAAVPAIVMHGLEYDDSTTILYGVSSHNNGLYNINKTTGAATLIGTSGLTSFTNLGYNSDTNVMYSTNSGTDSFYLMDRATGATTLIGPLSGPTNPNGLAYNWTNHSVYLVCNNTDSLYTINLATGAPTVVGSTGTGNLLGLAYLNLSACALRGDANCDTVRDAADVAPFALGLVDLAAYQIAFPTCDPACALDINQDTFYDGNDIPGLVTCLLGGSCP